jgi:hypothetical protein
MEKLGEDHLDVQELLPRGLTIMRLFSGHFCVGPEWFKIRVPGIGSWWSKPISSCNKSRSVGRVAISVVFVLGSNVTAESASPNYIRALAATIAGRCFDDPR